MPMTSSRRSAKPVVKWDDASVEVLRKLYVDFDRTVDDLASDKSLASDFNRLFAQKSGMTTTAEVVLKKLLNLRKRGARKGGLPTIRH